LRKEESATIFAHSAEFLADIKEETTTDKLEENVDKIVDLPA